MTEPPLYPETFTYDGFGQMTSSYVNGVTTTYAYRADGLRKSKTANGVITRHVWDGDQIVQDRTGWYTTTEYVRGIRLIDTFTYGDYARFTYIQNARGDVVGFVDGLTSIADTVDYDGFGTYESYTPTNPLGYCGEYRDAETGFIYLRARYYDPSIGRFTTEDPARDGLNWYVYCANNPVNFVDPWGLAPTKEEAAAMANHIYGDYDMGKDGLESRTIAGWRLIDIFDGGVASSIKLGIYIPNDDDWTNPSEYVLVFRGSTTSLDMETASVWANNLLAYGSSASVDMWAAISAGIYFDATHSQEITFVGHSKGGGEAIAAATATNNNAITFNAANFDFSNYGLIERNKSGITNYYIEGEFLSSLIGKSRYGTNISVATQYWNKYNVLGFEVTIPAPFKNHSIDAFRDAWGLEW